MKKTEPRENRINEMIVEKAKQQIENKKKKKRTAWKNNTRQQKPLTAIVYLLSKVVIFFNAIATTYTETTEYKPLVVHQNRQAIRRRKK